MGTHEDFDAMTRYGARYAAAKHGVALSDDACEELVAAWERVRAYDDALPALQALHASGVRCAVLTNGTPATSLAAMANAGIEGFIDAMLSVESAGVFKPDRSVYALVTTHYACAPADLVFATANGWDATGAAAFGLRVAWCNRLGAPHETFGPPPTWTMRGLHDLPALIA